MTLWDSVVDEIFFGGREKKAMEQAAAEAVPAAPQAPVVKAAKPMSAWDRAVDEIFFGGREAAALAAAEALQPEAAAEQAVEAAASAEAETVPAAPETPVVKAAKPMSAWDRAVDEIFFGGREAAALAAAEASQPDAAEAEADEPSPADAEPAEAAPAEAEPEAFSASDAEEKLMALQHRLQELKIPVVIVVEGLQASGKGTVAGELLEGLDPRGYDVCVNSHFTKEEDLYPHMRRYWTRMPKQGMVTVFIGSWYQDLCAMLAKGKHPKRSARRLEQIRLMEQMLLRDGAIIEKFFIDVPAKVQKKRLKELAGSKLSSHTVSKADWAQNKHYDRWQKAYQQAMDESTLPGAAWHILNGEDKKAAKRAMYDTVIASLEKAIALRQSGDRTWDTDTLTDHDPIATEPIPELELYETDLTLDREYKEAISAAQKKLHKLQYQLDRKGIPVVLAFEGWDAAGKGGSIRRLTSALDPRGFTVVPIASPTAEEKAHHHLWRFWKALPKKGKILIFDRTWYGRAMVERLEGFCTEAQWKRSYEEMNLFEQDLTQSGAVVCKFWLQISPDEQLKRFNARATNPDKQWKITDEDWRNREKWDLYETAINEMLKKTNTAYAPWTVVEADNKHYARVKVLETVIAAIEKQLEAE